MAVFLAEIDMDLPVTDDHSTIELVYRYTFRNEEEQ